MTFHRGIGFLTIALSVGTFAFNVHAEPSPAPSVKEQKVTSEVQILHASQGPKPFLDPQITDKARLKDPPFSSYNTYKLIEKKTLSSSINEVASYALPNGRTLELKIEPKEAGVFKVLASIRDPKGGALLKSLELTAKRNEAFFVAGQNYKEGVLVLAISVK